jgi:uncharacterized protein DUF4347/parallel beta helix pectate lyase-like protein
MFLLEDRILFDAAIAIDIADAANADDQSDDFDNNSDNATEQNIAAFLQSPYEAEQAMQLPINPYIDAVVRDALDGNLAALGLDGDFALPNMDNSAQTQVLLISDSLDNADELYESAGDNTIAIRYDAANATTEQLLEQIEQSLDGEKINRLGIAQQSDSNGKIDLLTNDSDTELWTGLNALMADDASIDLFASDMADSEFTDALAALTGHEVNYSDNLTGSDGDWTLENGDINLANTYFNGEAAQNVNFSVMPAEPAHELIVIDSAVMDAESIIDDLDSNTDVIMIDGDSELIGLEQINAWLKDNGDEPYDSISLISHSNEGYLILDGEVIDSSNVAEYQAKLAELGSYLSEDGDVMLYGCNLAESVEGQQLVETISEYTGADVAASTNDTTNADDGDWTLEYNEGIISAANLNVNGYNYYLDSYIVTTNTDVTDTEDGVLSLREAVTDANSHAGSVITFDLSADNEVIALTQANIDITADMTIDGDNADGSGTDVTVQVQTPGITTFRVFKVSNSATVNISNMTIKGGDISGNGNAIAGYGGGIYIGSSSDVTLENVTVSDGKAFDGGGIMTSSSTFNISNSTVSSNTSEYGGGIYIASSVATLENVTASNNNASNHGGGIMIYDSTTSIKDSLIIENNSQWGGGIFNYQGSTVNLLDSTVSDNTAAYNGGGMYNEESNVTVGNSTFTSNTSAYGGGIFLYNNNSFSIINSNVNNNRANEYGGGIQVELSTASIENCVINNNHADGGGGGINIYDGTLTIYSSTVSNNSATWGGGICSGPGNVTVVNSTISRNTAAWGGGVYFNDNSVLKFINSTISSNYVYGGGGGFYLYSGSLYIINSIVAYNYNNYGYDDIQSGDGGGFVANSESNIIGGTASYTYTDGEIPNLFANYYQTIFNYSGLRYEAIHADNGGDTETVALAALNAGVRTGSYNDSGSTNFVFFNGTNWVKVEDGTTVVTSGGVTEVTTDQRGYYRDSSSVSVGAYQYDGIVAWSGGDGSYATAVNTYSTVQDAENSADSTIYLTETSILLASELIVDSDKTFISGTAGGTATLRGIDGATHRTVNISSSNVTLENMTIKGGNISANGNVIAGYGGAIYIGSSSDVILEKVTVSSGKAYHGGGISNFSSTLSMNNSTVSSNTANQDGGGIYNTASGIVTLTSSTISGNNANEGGGLFNLTGSININNSIIAYNYLSDNSGYSDIYNNDTITGDYNIIGGLLIGANSTNYSYTNGMGATLFAAYNTVLANTIYKPVLADNGGDTFTVALASSSIANGAGTVIGAPLTDQRGYWRLSGIDVGAYQFDGMMSQSGDYITVNNGTWSTLEIWNIYNGTNWITATVTPDSTVNNIYVQHNVEISANITIDQTVVLATGDLNVNSGKILTIADGTGTDLTILGSFTNDGTTTTAANSYVLYNGGNQTIAALAYSQLGITGGGTTKTFADGITSIAQEIVLTENISLTGSSRDNVAVQVTTPGTGGTASRVFNINASSAIVNISNMTIKGGDISGDSGYGGGIRFHGGGILNLDMVNISDSKAYGGGGISIYANTTTELNITNSSVSGNSANYGGGIFNYASKTGSIANLTLTNSTVSGNSASSYGGGIYNRAEYGSTTINLTSSSISGNSATTHGGGIYNWANHTDSNATVNIYNNSSINNNNSTDSGGGIYNYANSGSATINLTSSSTISGNSSTDSGGGIFNKAYQTSSIATINLASSTISNNSTSSGGGIFNYASKTGSIANLTLTNSTVSGNSATTYGGGIYNRAEYGSTTVNINSSSISDNSSTDNGGGIYNYACKTGSSTTVNLTNSSISDNSSTDNGGGIYNYAYETGSNANLTLINSTISGNSSNSGSGIYTYQMVGTATLNMTNSIVGYNFQSDNSGYSDLYNNGGSISGDYNIIGGLQVGTNSTNYSYTNGMGATLFAAYTEISANAIYKPVLADNGGDTFTVALASNSIAKNAGTATGAPATDQRGMARPSGAKFDIGAYEFTHYNYRTIASGNWSTAGIWEFEDGGVWTVAAVAPDAFNELITLQHAVNIDTDVAIDQTVVTTGGSLTVNSGQTLTVVDGTGTDLTITGSFTNNGTTTTASNSYVLYNGSDQTIAALTYSQLGIAGAGSTKTFADSITSIAQEIVLTENITLTGSSRDNVTVQVTTPGNGGTAARVFNVNASGATVNISNMTIKGGDISSNYTAPIGYGGGIVLQAGTLNIDTVNISGSKAYRGGGIAVYANATALELNLTNSTISGNSASYGGGIYNYANQTGSSAIVDMTNSTISGNIVRYYGGGIYNYASQTDSSAIVDMTNSTISDNSSSATVDMTNSTIIGISPIPTGGGIYNYANFGSSATVDMTNCTISGNSASYGGGIYNNVYSDSSATVNMTNSIVSYNYLRDNSTYSDIIFNNSATITGDYNIVGGMLVGANSTNYSYTDGMGAALFAAYNTVLADTIYTPVLADNGGLTMTVALTSSSIAIDAGTATGAPLTDQRGYLRLSGIDIGAYQFNGIIPQTGDYITVNNGTWATIANWKVYDGSNWVLSTLAPDTTSNNIYITHDIEITANISIDQTTVTESGNLTVNSGQTLTVTDGSGTDLTIAGSFTNDGTTTTTTDSYVLYNGGDQTIAALAYSQLGITGTGTIKTFANGITSVAQNIVLTENITLTGSSRDNVTVQVTTPGTGGTASRVFNITASSAIVNISNMTIKGGDINFLSGIDSYGGGVLLQTGTLDLSAVNVSDSRARYGGGIALYSNNTTVELNITNTAINKNIASIGGGIYTYTNFDGIYTNPGRTTVDITNSTVSGNSARYGGGVYLYAKNDYTIATVTLTNSTISNNNAEYNGGGFLNIAVFGSSATVTLANSTISDNSANEGGGIYNSGVMGSITVNLTNSTISGNNANEGGGLFNLTGSININNSIVAYNYLSDNSGYSDIYNNSGTITGDYNIVGGLLVGANSTNYSYHTNGKGDSLFANYDPKLADSIYKPVLADNGGDTVTVALASNSIAINAGTATGAPATDQRGYLRLSGIDIGSYQFDGTLLSQTDDYITVNDGILSTIANWHIYNGSAWVVATVAPDSTVNNIYIIHDITITASVTIDQTLISSSGNLTVNSGQTLTIADGTGTDLTILGSFTNDGTTTTAANSYVLYNGGNQTIAALAYSQLGITGAGTTKTFADGTTSITEEIILTSAGMTLTGDSAANTTVQVATPGAGGTAARVFHTNVGAGNTINIENITIKGGDISGLSGDAANGGTIFHESGTLNINEATITGSKAINGGAIYSTGNLNITGSTINSAYSTNNGGGIYNTATLSLSSTTVDNNIAARSGGGISSYQDIETTVEDSTVSNNNAGRYAGILSYDSTLVMVNSTVSGNIASSIVGGIGSFKGTISLLNTTISNNNASVAFGTVYNNRSQLYLVNSILIGNPLSGGGDDNAIQTSSAGGDSFAFYSWYDATKIVGSLTTNVNSPNLTSPSDGTLGTLADNGGSTLTMAVQAGSNIIGAGTYIYHNFIDGYYFSDQSNTTFYHLNHDIFTPFFPGGKITDDQRGETRDPAFIPTMGAYEVNTTMIDELPDSTEYSSDEFSDMLKVHKATQNQLDIALMEFTV